jgi:hypothetical protein
MPLEFILLSICFGSQMNNEACKASLDKYQSMNPEINEQIKMYERNYTRDVPSEVLVAGSIVNFIYKKEIKLGIYKGWYIDLKQGQDLLGYKFSF